MIIEYPNYNPICKIDRLIFVIQRVGGYQNRYYSYFCPHYTESTGFKDKHGVSGAEYIKRKHK